MANPGSLDSERRLEVSYELTGFDHVIYTDVATWPGCRFVQNKPEKGTLTIWEDAITTQDDLSEARKRIFNAAKRFVLAMELAYRRILIVSDPTVKNPRFPSDDLTLTATAHISVTMEGEIISHNAPPPEMPSAPIECERWILTLAEATAFQGYVEEQLRRHYLIIEELWDEFSHEFDAVEKAARDETRLIRNFVSHPVCSDSAVVAFIASRFPKAIHRRGGQDVAIFQRDVPHRNFVSKFEVRSRELARMLVEKKVSSMSATP
jgi:hypothetical protein